MQEWFKQKTQDWAFKKFLDGIYGYVALSSLSGTITGVIGHMERLPIAAIITYMLIVFVGTMAAILLFLELREKTGESARKKHRLKSIQHGAKIIFENREADWVTNVVNEWADSCLINEIGLFSKEKIYQRIHCDYVHPLSARITLLRSDEAIKRDSVNPVLYMLLEKTEFIRWLTENEELPVPESWFKLASF